MSSTTGAKNLPSWLVGQILLPMNNIGIRMTSLVGANLLEEPPSIETPGKTMNFDFEMAFRYIHAT